MLSQIVVSTLYLVSTFYLTVVLLRFLLQLARADFYNPICQFVVKATNPPLKPLRKIIPSWGAFDGAALLLAIVIQALVYVGMLAAMGDVTMISPVTIFAWAVIKVVSIIAKIYFWAILAVVILSWIAPAAGHPGVQLLMQLTEPVMNPVRKVIPSMGGLDLSPIVVFLILNVVTVVIDNLGRSAGMHQLGLPL
ncbi:YggT family protein [Hydrocarboniclastica marina]|uniref:YggT family protein n=1 Tax=Hydrocarboniclastica marina TaxID=2259620 RepID=A0A4P7XE26_9ALTE|nr:YggT family protein [Hydrocarboniclastica marina]QCF24793.1 YggT family protein [Hydrocarboniclastica marina]|tara:strand:+ start:809 stop:1390 length:582 start_codon:yes stop_codon:yes gene_type:complete